MDSAAHPAGHDAAQVLAVDLDGTLLRSDLLLESFWELAARDLGAALAAAAGLGAGRAALKAALAGRARIDPASLPYDEAVLAHVRAWRAAGGRAVLVTASDQRLARAVADHLGCFDEVHGSDGTTNLKGRAKAGFLVERFGEKGFDYIGDSRADLAVWPHARRALTAGAGAGLRRALEAAHDDVEHLGRPAGPAPYLRALRPHQWAKNALVFLPPLTGHVGDPATWGAALAAFVAFSLVASGVYLLNDLLDLAADRAHPRKRRRPLAAGTLPILHGSALAPGLFAAGLAVALIFAPGPFVLVLAGYLALTMAYSLTLKRRLIIDICTLAGLYTIRLIGGGVATCVALSPWLMAFAIFLFLALAAVKRQAELVSDAARGREGPAGRSYVVGDLPIMAMMALAAGYVAVLVLALYVNSAAVQGLYSAPDLLWGICLVLLYWISRIVMLTHRGWMHDDPVVFALRDRNSRVCVAAVLAIAVAASLL